MLCLARGGYTPSQEEFDNSYTDSFDITRSHSHYGLSYNDVKVQYSLSDLSSVYMYLVLNVSENSLRPHRS